MLVFFKAPLVNYCTLIIISFISCIYLKKFQEIKDHAYPNLPSRGRNSKSSSKGSLRDKISYRIIAKLYTSAFCISITFLSAVCRRISSGATQRESK